LAELFDSNLAAQPTVAPLVPQLKFVLDDISGLVDDALSARELGLVPTLTLWALRDARSPARFSASLLRWGPAMQALAVAEGGAEALLPIFRYLCLVVEDLTPQALHSALHRAAPETEKVLMTLAEQWKAEGEARGKAEGARRVRLRQLELKYGELPRADRDRIDRANEDQLLLWSERIFTAESLSELLGG
jgi:hypothetical protein